MVLIIPDIRGPEPIVWDSTLPAVAITAHDGHRPDAGWYAGARRLAIWKAGVRVTGLIQDVAIDRPIRDQAEDLCDLLGAIYPGEFVVGKFTEDQHTREQWEEWREIVDKRLGYAGYNGAWLMTEWAMQEEFGHAITDPAVRTWISRHTATEPRVPYDLWHFADNPNGGGSGYSYWPGCIHQLDERIGGVEP